VERDGTVRPVNGARTPAGKADRPLRRRHRADPRGDGDGLAIRRETAPDRRGGVLTAIGASWLALLNELGNVATEERRPVAGPANPQRQTRGGAMAKRILHRVASKAGVKVRPRFYHWA
jgi:hypothetical protein